MLGNPLSLLIDTLATDGAGFVLGAGASMPHVPTIAELSTKVGRYANLLSSFPAAALPPSPLRDLVAPMIERARAGTTIEEWRASAMTPATIATILEHLISQAHWQRLPQYAVFRLVPLSASIVSFNWDGLARIRCPQAHVIHPHGVLRPRSYSDETLRTELDLTQLYDEPAAQHWILPGLVMPGGEEAASLAPMRQQVFATWLSAPTVIVIGYSFGLGSHLRYDRVWLDTFVEALGRSGAPIHFLSPDAVHLRGQVAELIKRSVNLHAWPCDWHSLSRALLASTRMHACARFAELRVHERTLDRLYRTFMEHPVTAA